MGAGTVFSTSPSTSIPTKSTHPDESASTTGSFRAEFASGSGDPLGTPSHDPIDTTRSDNLAQYVRDGLNAHGRGDNWGIDAASRNLRQDPTDRSRGNPEGMGMVDGVGSASGTKRFFDGGGKQGQGMI